MYEFLLLFSAVLAFASISVLVLEIQGRGANAGTNLLRRRAVKPEPEEHIDPVIPFELIVEKLQAARRARELENCNAMA